MSGACSMHSSRHRASARDIQNQRQPPGHTSHPPAAKDTPMALDRCTERGWRALYRKGSELMSCERQVITQRVSGLAKTHLPHILTAAGIKHRKNSGMVGRNSTRQDSYVALRRSSSAALCIGSMRLIPAWLRIRQHYPLLLTCRHRPPMRMCLVSRHDSMPSWPSSRPKPLSFHPPKGAPNSDTSFTLIPTPPASSRSAVNRAVVRSRV